MAIKQTNHATTFMLSQYRAVFKNAYFKGLSVVMIGSSLAGIQGVQAAETDSGATTDVPLLFDEGNYTIKVEDSSGSLLKGETTVDLNELNSTSTIGQAFLDKGVAGVLHMQGQVELRNAKFSSLAKDPLSGGARISFDKTTPAVDGSSFYNIVTITGENEIGELLTIDSTTQLIDGNAGNKISGTGSLKVNGYLTVSKGAEGSDLSAVDITIAPMASGGTNEGYGDLTLDPNITVGNLTFASASKSTDIDLFYDQGTGGIEATGHSGSRTITVADSKAVTFASGAHTIKSTVQNVSGIEPSLVFAGGKTAKVENQGTLNVERPVTFSGGIAFNNAGSLVTIADSPDASVTPLPTEETDGVSTIEGSTGEQVTPKVAKQGDITINAGSAFTNTGKVTVGSGTVFSVAADALVNGLPQSSTVKSLLNFESQDNAENSLGQVLAEAVGQEFEIDLDKALGDFTSSGQVVLTGGTNKADHYIFTTDSGYLKKLGVDFGQSGSSEAKLVLDNTSLQLAENISLSSDTLKSNVQGIKTQADGISPQLRTTSKLTYTTQKDTKAEDLNGLALFGQQLHIQSGKEGPTDAESILVSGSEQTILPSDVAIAPSITFGASQSVTSQGNKALVFQNAALLLKDFSVQGAASVATSGTDTTPQGTVGSDLTFTNNGQLYIADKAWTAQNISLKSGSSLTLDANYDYVGLTAKVIEVDTNSSMTLNGGSLDVTALLSSGTVNGNAVNINVAGDGRIGLDFAGGEKFVLTDSTINLNNVADTIGIKYHKNTSGQAGTFEVADAQKFKSDNSIIKIDIDQIADLNQITLEEANNLLEAITVAGSTGLVSLTGDLIPKLPITVNTETGEKELNYSDLTSSDTLQLTFDTPESREARLTNVPSGGKVTGGWMGVETDGSEVVVSTNGTLALYGPANGQYTQDTNGDIVGLFVEDRAGLNLFGKGKVGAIRGGSGASFTVQAGAEVSAENTQGLAQDINIENLNNYGQLTAGAVTSQQASLAQNAILNANSLNIAQSLQANHAQINVAETAALGTSALFEQSTLSAKNAIADSLQLTSSSLIKIADTLSANNIKLTGDSVIQATNISLGSGGELWVGVESSSNTTPSGNESTTPASYGVNLLADNTSEGTASSGDVTTNPSGDSTTTTPSGSGDTTTGGENNTSTTNGSAHVIAGNLDLNGGRLILDPDFGQATATLFANSIGSAKQIAGKAPSTSGIMAVNGDIVIGRNSALGLGDDEQSFRNALAKHQSNGSLSEKGIGAYLYVDRAGIDLNGNKLIVSTKDINTLLTQLNTNTADIQLDSGSAVQVTAKAVNAAGNSTVFVNLGSDKTLASDNGQVIVPANMSGEQFAKIFGNQLNLADKSTLKVTTENGLYSAEITTTDALHGNFDFKLADNARNILSNLSDATYKYLTNILSNQSAYYASQADFDNAAKNASSSQSAYGTNGVAIVEDSAGYMFLQDAAGASNSSAIEQVARLGTFGGGMQSAMMASDVNTDAINSRLGFGAAQINGKVMPGHAEGNLWALPIYKHHSSKDLEANGLGYGLDADLYGAALGLDSAFSNGFRIGAMFNLGKGDVSGEQVGSGVKNDFDYYGFAAYMGFNPVENLQITADVGYAVTDNDLSSSVGITGYDKMSAQVDTKAITAGLGLQYTLKGAVDVTPHAALRYTRLDMDDYDVKIDGEKIAHIKSDSANLFSVPVGLSLSKEIRNGSTLIKPFVDLNATLNFGDRDAESSTTFNGIYGTQASYQSELVDDFTYGVAVGLDMQQGNFKFGLNAGYTGSESTDDYSVNANVRFVF